MLSYITSVLKVTSKKTGLPWVRLSYMLVETGKVGEMWLSGERFADMITGDVQLLDLTKIGGPAYDMEFDSEGTPVTLAQV